MSGRSRSPLPWLGGLLALYLLAPIAAFLVRLRDGISSTPGVGSALLTSLLTATISLAAIAALGLPLAYVLARANGRAARALTALVALPIALPPLMSGLLLLYIVGPYTEAGRLFGGGLTETRVGIVLAQTFVAAPFLVIAARAAFAGIDPTIEDVAASLGHGHLARFARVAVPTALPGIGAGLMLAWLRAFGEFGATVILAYHPYSLPVFTFVQFGATGLPATMLPIALALAAALAVLLPLQLVARPRRRRDPPPAAPMRAMRPTSGVALDFAVAKRLGTFSLDVAYQASGPRLALLGASGAGKTLTLRLLAGLISCEPDGHLRAGAQTLHGLPAEQRRIGYVPQQPALLPRRTVWRQVTFGVRARPELAAWWLERLGLRNLKDRYPDELSVGQQRRVMIARALAIQPRVLLLDEPFTGLDTPLRDGLRRELRRLQREADLSTVIVTHDPEEAALLADEIVILGEGRVLQSGSRESVFGRPGSAEIAGVLGIVNAHRGFVLGPGRLVSSGAEISAPTGGLPVGAEVVWRVRPERISLTPDGQYAATLVDDADLGSLRELTILLDGALELLVRTYDTRALMVGESLRVDLTSESIGVWPTTASAIDAATSIPSRTLVSSA